MKFNTYVLLALLCFPMAIHPMANTFRKGFYKTCNAINIGLPLAPLTVGVGIAAYSKITGKPMNQKPEDLPDAPPIVCDFVHKNLAMIGFHNPDLKIKYGNIGDTSNVTEQALALPDYEMRTDNPNSLVSLLQKQEPLSAQDQEKLNKIASVIQHEGTHLNGKDNRYYTQQITGATLLLTNYRPFYNLYQNRILKTPFVTPSMLRSLSLIPGGFVKLFIQIAVSGLASQYREQKADDGIADNIDILQAAANDFRKSAQEDALHYQRNYQHLPMLEKLNYDLKERFASHPSNEQRAKKLEQRIAALKDKEAQQSLEKK